MPFVTEKNFYALVQDILNNLQNLGVQFTHSPSDYKLVINERALKRLGRCTLKKDNNNHFYYEIQINKFHNELSPRQDIMDTLIHEIIHSLPNCMNHGKIWAAIASKYNKAYNTSIYRTSKGSDAYNNFVKSKEQQKSSYSLSCSSCGRKWSYKRKTKLIKLVLNGKKIKCPYCGPQTFTCEYKSL